MHQLQRLRVDDTCTKLLENPTDSRFWRRQIVIGDGKWVFYRNAANKRSVWIKPAAQPTTVQVVKQDCFTRKIMLSVWWWNFEGIINFFELVQNGAVNAAYSTVNNWIVLTPLSRLIIQP